MSKKAIAVALAAAAVAAAVAVFALRDGGAGEGEAEEPATEGRAAKRPPDGRRPRAAGNAANAKTAKTSAAAKRTRIRQPRVDTKDRTDLSPADKRLMLSIENAIDNENLEALRKIVAEASASANAEVRSDLVDALAWFGKDAMLEIMPLMADDDESVRESAVDAWTNALGEVDDMKMRGTMIESVMKILKNEDALQAMTIELNGLEDLDALQVLVNVIEEPGISEVASKTAKEHYEFITGEEWNGIDAAEQWLRENSDDDSDDD